MRSRRSLLSGGGDGREVTVVMIPQEGKDLSKAKGWRPIVLMNCLLRLKDKVVANELQQLDLFHQEQFRSRKAKAAIYMAIQEAQLEMVKGKGCAWALGDINYTRTDTVLARLRQKQYPDADGLTRYIHWFYQPQKAELTWDGEVRTVTTVKSGIPQGSPLPPVPFLIGVAKVLEDADLRIHREIPSHQVKIYSYVDDFNCTARQNSTAPTRRGGQPETITAARKARPIVSEELGKNG